MPDLAQWAPTASVLLGGGMLLGLMRWQRQDSGAAIDGASAAVQTMNEANKAMRDEFAHLVDELATERRERREEREHEAAERAELLKAIRDCTIAAENLRRENAKLERLLSRANSGQGRQGG